MIGSLLVAAVVAGLLRAMYRAKLRRRLPGQGGRAAWSLAHEREALVGLTIGFLLKGVPGAWAGLGLGIAAGELKLRRAETTRLRRIDRQLPELARSLAASLRVGGDVSSAFASASRELPEPIATPLRSLTRSVVAGKSIHQALDAFRLEVPTEANQRLVEALKTGLEVGGRISDMLRFVGEQLRERADLDRQRMAATSQGRLSAIVVGGMPIAFLALTGVSESSPSRMLLTEPAGWVLLFVGLSLEALGFWWVHRLVRG